MTQNERLLYLINYLIGENIIYRNIDIPVDNKERFNLYRSLINVRIPHSISEEYLEIEDEYLTQLNRERGTVNISDLSEIEKDIYLWQGDITTLSCDAIVNAANNGMTGCYHPLHACIDNCIHTFAGVRLRLECADIMKKQGHEEATGQAKITSAYNLPCKSVIHTVGPIVQGLLTSTHEKQLESSYRSCIEFAEKNEIKSIAFCCISTGVFGFPQQRAAEIAVRTVKNFKEKTKSEMKVIFNVFKDEDYELYRNLLG